MGSQLKMRNERWREFLNLAGRGEVVESESRGETGMALKMLCYYQDTVSSIMNAQPNFRTLRWLFLVSGVVFLAQALITGRLHIKGGKWITTKSVPHNPIVRSETPRDFWFAWGLGAFIFGVIVFAFFAVM